MDMTPDEIVVRYRQAKVKGKQLNILAELNACSVDDIVKVLVEHGGYKLDRLSRSRGKARLLKEEEEAPAKELVKAAEAIKDFDAALTKGQELEKQIPYKKPEPIPPEVRKAIDRGFADLLEMIQARKNNIHVLQCEIEELEKEADALRAWKEEHE